MLGDRWWVVWCGERDSDMRDCRCHSGERIVLSSIGRLRSPCYDRRAMLLFLVM